MSDDFDVDDLDVDFGTMPLLTFKNFLVIIFAMFIVGLVVFFCT
jgi:hypothetical protein